MKTEITYRGYFIEFKAGYYWIAGTKQPYPNLQIAKEIIDFWVDEELIYCND